LPARPCLYNKGPISTTCLCATPLNTQSSDPFLAGAAREALTMTRTMMKESPPACEAMTATGTRWKSSFETPYVARAARLAAAHGVGPTSEEIRPFRLRRAQTSAVGSARHMSIHFAETTPTSRMSPSAAAQRLPRRPSSVSFPCLDAGVGMSALDGHRSMSAVSQDLEM